ncbi:MAG: 1-deoxy-D-xylulose-5-phosphate reductoisomerase [Candidatus Omnitrophica bacterium]|nr:1-deoxy-D-xylulose-5-phosphate reductoisomerase [Candidatus Omnitrophota bacterium]
MKNIAILGSTGSIGRAALEVVRHFPDRFRVVGLTANSNIDILYKQVKEFRPLLVCVRDKLAARKLSPLLKSSAKLFQGEDGLDRLVQDSRVEQILLAIAGSGALLPLLKAIEAGKAIALANKEALVCAGPLIINEARKRKVEIIPIDSEQSAIWQCLEGKDLSKLKTIYLTASGGPFRNLPRGALKDISIAKVLKHPRWKMGKKISVDSATLMNKGLELLEAMFLFEVPYDKIKILIHPEALIHSMVEFIDGIVLAQLSATDMRIPIQYAISYPDRLNNSLPRIDFYRLKELHFQVPDFKRFPCLGLAYRAARVLGTMPAVLNAANEVCVEEFLKKKLAFIAIPEIIEKVMDRHRNIMKNPNLEDILEADSWARLVTGKLITNN